MEYYVARCESLHSERSDAVQQLARALKSERQRGRTESHALQQHISSLEEREAYGEDCARRNASLEDDLEVVGSLIDRLEGQPGYTADQLRQRRAEERDGSSSSSAEPEAEGHSVSEIAKEVAALREKNALLEHQVEVISEKMYGSPARLAALDRERLQSELDHERGGRLAAVEVIQELHSQLDEKRTKGAEDAANEELERARQALHAAQMSAVVAASTELTPLARTRMRGEAAAPARRQNPIAAPRHQFGSSHARTKASPGPAARQQQHGLPKRQGPGPYR